MRIPWLLPLLPLLLVVGELQARIKLITLPPRERVAVQLDHPRLSLVEEERLVPLVRGLNQIDFSWTGTRIDPETLVFRVLGTAEPDVEVAVEVLSVSYPPGEQALVWTVSAEAAVTARVRISYLLGGLDKRFHYRALSDPDERELSLSQYLRIENYANERYPDTQVWAGFGDRVATPLGLAETKQLRVGRYPRIPVRKLYLADPVEHGYLAPEKNQLNVPLHYVFENAAVAGLGAAPLPPGKVRIFQRDGRGGNAFLGEDWGGFTPIDGELSLFLGLARDVVLTREVVASERTRVAGDLYHYQIVLRYRIENFKDRPAQLRLIERPSQIRRQVGRDSPREPQWTLGEGSDLGAPDPERSAADRLVFELALPARESAEAPPARMLRELHLVLHNEW